MPTRKRKRKKVDPNAPARPASAYTLYMAKFRQKIIDKNGFRQSDIASIGRELGRTWKSLTAKQRHPYEKKAQKQYARYQTEKAEYEATCAPIRTSTSSNKLNHSNVSIFKVCHRQSGSHRRRIISHVFLLFTCFSVTQMSHTKNNWTI